MTIKFLLTFCCPSNYSMSISSSVHNNINSVVDVLVKVGYSDSEVDEIMRGETYYDDECWVKVQRIEL